jgi:hypothetical protein
MTSIRIGLFLLCGGNITLCKDDIFSSSLKIIMVYIETIDYYEGHDQLSRPSINNKGFTDEYLAREIFAKVATKIIYMFCDEIRIVFCSQKMHRAASSRHETWQNFELIY